MRVLQALPLTGSLSAESYSIDVSEAELDICVHWPVYELEEENTETNFSYHKCHENFTVCGIVFALLQSVRKTSISLIVSCQKKNIQDEKESKKSKFICRLGLLTGPEEV